MPYQQGSRYSLRVWGLITYKIVLLACPRQLYCMRGIYSSMIGRGPVDTLQAVSLTAYNQHTRQIYFMGL